MSTTQLKNVVKITSGFAFKSNLFGSSGGIPLVRIRDVKRGYSDTYYSGDYDPLYIVNNEDFLIGMDGEFNAERWKGGKALLNQRVCKIEPSSSSLKKDYLYYFLPKELKKIEHRTPSVTVKHLSVKKISEIEISLPPISTQKRITSILDKANAICRNREKSIRLADAFLRSIFLDMFGDPVTNPKRWPEIRLDLISEIKSGVTKGRKLEGKKTVSVPYMRVANVQDGYIDLSDVQNIEVLEKDVEKYSLKIGDILLTEGGDPDKLGRGAVWKGEISPCIHQNHIFKVRADNHQILPEYLSYLIGSARGKIYFLRAAKQTTGVASINKTQLSGFPALVPPLENQRNFLMVAKKVKNLVNKHKENYENSMLLFNSISQRAFRGEL